MHVHIYARLAQFVLGDDSTRVAIVEFNAGAMISQVLTSDADDLADVIAAYTPAGNTAISEGLDVARQMLMETAATRKDATRVILLLTDGVQNDQYGGDKEAIRAGQQLRDETSALLIAVGFGGAAAQTLDMIATPPAASYSLLGSEVSK